MLKLKYSNIYTSYVYLVVSYRASHGCVNNTKMAQMDRRNRQHKGTSGHRNGKLFCVYWKMVNVDSLQY